MQYSFQRPQLYMLSSSLQVILLIVLTMLAFAGNSVLCRLALGQELIDAGSFTVVRLLSGALILSLIVKGKASDFSNGFSNHFVRELKFRIKKNGWPAIFLFIYAVCFSYAYISLDTGVGALILFGFVQITLIVTSLYYGHKLHIFEWCGVALAFAGLVYLVLPTLNTPSMTGFLLMAVSGVAWGAYSFVGRGSKEPVHDTQANFCLTIPFVLILLTLTYFYSHMSLSGLILACLSGGVTSALGYTLWFKVVGRLSANQAGVVQLSVPVLAALGGVLFANEILTIRLVASGIMILGGILIVALGRQYMSARL